MQLIPIRQVPSGATLGQAVFGPSGQPWLVAERKRVRSHFVDLTHHEVKFRPDRSRIGF
jgi:hypothetical protein